jgi:hypothetical protein
MSAQLDSDVERMQVERVVQRTLRHSGGRGYIGIKNVFEEP